MCSFFVVCYYNRVEIKVKKLKTEAQLPVFAHVTDAGADLFAAEQVTISAHSRGVVSTGIAVEIPEGYAGLIWDKSGLATKNGITTIAGVIDAGYRGEIGVAISNISNEDYTFAVGDKVAQMLFQKIEQIDFSEAAILHESSRNEAGFGSTGK